MVHVLSTHLTFSAGFTGIDDPYEAPMNPDIVLCSERNDIASIGECVQKVVQYLQQHVSGGIVILVLGYRVTVFIHNASKALT